MWENCKNWWNEQYTKFFPNTPKTVEDRIDWANSVYKKAILKNDSLLLAEAYYLFGKYEFVVKKDYLKTKYWFLKSLAIQEKMRPGSELSRINLWLGYNEALVNNYDGCLNYSHKASKIAEVAQDERAMANSYMQLSVFYAQNLKYLNKDSAKIYADKARISATKSKHTGILTALNLNNASLENSTNIQELENAVRKVAPSEQKATFKVASLLKLAQIYIDNNNLDFAESRLKEAKEANKKISYFYDMEKLIETTEINLLAKKGNFKPAYFLLENLRKKEVDNWDQERLKVVHSMQDQLKMLIAENQETEISLHRDNILLQRKFLWISGFLIAVSLITAGLFFLLSRKNRQISKQNALLVQEQNHRFNNNLQTISSLLTLKSNELNTADAKTVFSESKLLIQAIASLQRKLYSSDKLVSVDLHHLIPEVVSEVLAAFNMSKVKTIFEIPPIEVYADDALNLNLIFTELTINACKHAFNTTSEPLLKISMNATDEQIEFCFRDNGSEKVNYSTQSFGMFLIKQLVKQMQGSHKFYYDNGTVCEVKCKVKILA
jgi:two-component sensor histidine kinase